MRVCVARVAFGSCLEGQDVVVRAAGVRNRGRRSTLAMPLRNRGRRSTLAMPLPKSWQALHSVHLGVCLCGRGRIQQLSRGIGCCRARGGLCVCVAGVAFGNCLEGQDVVARAAGGVRNRGRRRTLAMPLRNRGRRSTLVMPLPKSWQAQYSVHLGAYLCGRGQIRQLAKSWQAQDFGDAVAENVVGAIFYAFGCSVIAYIQGEHGTYV